MHVKEKKNINKKINKEALKSISICVHGPESGCLLGCGPALAVSYQRDSSFTK